MVRNETNPEALRSLAYPATTQNTETSPMASNLTIYEVLRLKLGREPTHKELCDRVREILREAHAEDQARRAAAGKLWFQR